MKTLYLLRHAMAMPSDGKSDSARKLAPQGKDDALALGHVMKTKSYAPDCVLCSPSIRTRETLESITESLGDLNAEFPDKIYDGTRGDLLAFIQSTDDKHDSLLVVGHNPGIHELAAILALEDSATLMNRLAGGYKPGSLCRLECPIDSWAAIQPAENMLKDFLEPLDYNAPATPARWT